MTARRGQVALYLVVALVALTILMLANVGVFLAVRARNRAMNAVDAAAIAAARRQGEILNEIGRLNLRHAEAEYVGDWARALEIVKEQRRLAFLSPLDCIREANKVAKDNGALESADFSGILQRHVSDVRTKYMQNPELYPGPWNGAWEEYASALASLASEGIAAGCDNIDFVDAVECFPLTSKFFYSMIEGEAWCKLVVAGMTWLLDMDLHNFPLPQYYASAAVVNCEVCSLHLEARPLILDESGMEAFRAFLALNGAEFPEGDDLPVEDDRPLDDPSRVYFFYDSTWLVRLSNIIEDENLPFVGKIKPEFDVKGCASAFRVYVDIPQLMSESTRRSVDTAAAKPFGTIATAFGRSSVAHEDARFYASPASNGDDSLPVVVPAFEAVRLVHTALANEKDLSTADVAWLDHVREHVPRLLTDGVGGLSASCRYCSLLKKWNDPDFRARAAAWIAANAETCLRGKGGSGPNGGTPYAH